MCLSAPPPASIPVTLLIVHVPSSRLNSGRPRSRRGVCVASKSRPRYNVGPVHPSALGNGSTGTCLRMGAPEGGTGGCRWFPVGARGTRAYVCVFSSIAPAVCMSVSGLTVTPFLLLPAAEHIPCTLEHPLWSERLSPRTSVLVATKRVGGYCRLRMPLKPVLGARDTVVGHRLGALEGGGGA